MKKLSKAFDRIDAGMEFFEKNLATIMFAAMFIVFVVNIVFRYFFKAILWGYELSLLLFLWNTILGGCYANRTDENIKFDTVYNNGSERRKLVLDIIGSALVVSTFTISFVPSLNYILFLNFEASDALPLRKSHVFSIYMYFLVGMIFQYSRKLIASSRKLIAMNRREIPQ